MVKKCARAGELDEKKWIDTEEKGWRWRAVVRTTRASRKASSGSKQRAGTSKGRNRVHTNLTEKVRSVERAHCSQIELRVNPRLAPSSSECPWV